MVHLENDNDELNSSCWMPYSPKGLMLKLKPSVTFQPRDAASWPLEKPLMPERLRAGEKGNEWDGYVLPLTDGYEFGASSRAGDGQGGSVSQGSIGSKSSDTMSKQQCSVAFSSVPDAAVITLHWLTSNPCAYPLGGKSGLGRTHITPRDWKTRIVSVQAGLR